MTVVPLAVLCNTQSGEEPVHRGCEAMVGVGGWIQRAGRGQERWRPVGGLAW